MLVDKWAIALMPLIRGGHQHPGLVRYLNKCVTCDVMMLAGVDWFIAQGEEFERDVGYDFLGKSDFSYFIFIEKSIL